VPVVLYVSTLAPLELSHIAITVLAAPVVLNVSTFALLEFRVVEIAVVATPAVLNVSAFARLELGDVPVGAGECSKGTLFHCISVGVADVAGGAGPMVLDVLALGAFLELGNVFLAVVARPVVLNIAALTGLEGSHL
jgi:hypothetical protein